jgi:hypothetical protein
VNFVAIVQALRNRCSGMGGVDGMPTTVVGQTGDMARLVDWVRESWVDLQAMREDWLFMRDEFSGTVAAGTRELTAAGASVTDLSNWHQDTLRVYRTADGVAAEQYLVPWDYRVFRDTYMFGSQAQGLPTIFTSRPKDRAILLGPVPDADVTVTGEYQRSPQIFAADTDTPTGLPTEFHMLIVYMAMTRYAGNWAAPEVLVDAQNQMEVLMGRLVRSWTPEIGFGEPLA